MKLLHWGLAGLLVVGVLLSGIIPYSPRIATARGEMYNGPGAWKISTDLHFALQSLEPGEKLTVILTFNDTPQLDHFQDMEHAERVQSVISALQSNADASQKEVSQLLAGWEERGMVHDIETFWVFNGIAVTASQEVIDQLAAHPDIASITPNRSFDAPILPPGIQQIEQNLHVINAQALWELGYRGEGIVVANLDTGVDINHPDLESRWRGGSNSWFDPYGEHPELPDDKNGHGTWTMGVMVGGNSSGSYVGVAPEAQWIAAKIFDDSGKATSLAIHQAYQWILDPDRDPSTPDAPHIVNNSWGFLSTGCYRDFQQNLQALRAAGILPIFAAGNSGPGSNTSISPANYPEAFSVGAVDNSGLINSGSSRGPSACTGDIFPLIVAPGVSIRSTGLMGGYSLATGTSMAAPHVSGSLALLLNAFPALTVDQQEAALISSAVELGDPGPDNTYGHGQVDALAGFEWLVNMFGSPGNPGNPGQGPQVYTNFLYLPALLNTR
jgi:subtilisin family serine protease